MKDKEIKKISHFLKELALTLDEYMEKKKIEGQRQNVTLEAFREVLRTLSPENKNLLKTPASAKKEILLVAHFLDSFAAALVEGAEKENISLNRQTDLKTKLKEILQMTEKK